MAGASRATGDRQVSAERVIGAPPEQVFAVLADASRHPEIDGSGSVRRAAGDPEPLTLGSRFGMHMRIGLPYRITNTVVEYEPDRLIAWRHMAGHRWRYRLEPVTGPDGSPATRVTETFDWGSARVPVLLELTGTPARNRAAMERTLANLDRVVTGGGAV